MAKLVKVFDTKRNKEYNIHPDMARDQAWMAARGLIIQEDLKPFEVTNLTPEPKAKKGVANAS